MYVCIKGTKLVFSPIGPHVNFTPDFGFTLLAPSLLLVFFIKSSLVEIKSCKYCGLIPSFIKLYPVALTFWLYSNWGWNRDQRVKLGLKDRVTWRINFIFWRTCKLKEGAEILNCYCQGPSRPQWQKVTFQNRAGGGKIYTHTPPLKQKHWRNYRESQ